MKLVIFALIIAAALAADPVVTSCACSSGKWFDHAKKACTANPAKSGDTGYDANCKTYSDMAEAGVVKCVECKADFGLKTGACLKKPAASGDTGFVADCAKYMWVAASTEWKCIECGTGKSFKKGDQNTCENADTQTTALTGGKATLQQCQNEGSVTATTVCYSCASGNTLKGTVCDSDLIGSGATDCKESADKSGTIKCTVCNSGSVLSALGGGTCATGTVVAGCEDGQGTTAACNKCKAGFAKHSDDTCKDVKSTAGVTNCLYDALASAGTADTANCAMCKDKYYGTGAAGKTTKCDACPVEQTNDGEDGEGSKTNGSGSSNSVRLAFGAIVAVVLALL